LLLLLFDPIVLLSIIVEFIEVTPFRPSSISIPTFGESSDDSVAKELGEALLLFG
jgi:hypothetical protein